MHYKLKQKAIQLRTEQQFSYSAILSQIPVAKSTLSVWLKNYPLSKERILELKKNAWGKLQAKIEIFRTSMREKRERENNEMYEKCTKEFSAISRKSIFASGLMLYLAEGSKTNENKVCLTNTDPRILKFFLIWLLKFFKVSRERVRLFLQLYPTMNIDKEITFWLNELELDKKQVYKPFLRKLHKSSFSYKESFRHGTCAIILNDTKIKRQILTAIKAYTDVVLKNYTRV